MFVKRLKRHSRHFLERVALRKGDDEGISGKLETGHVIGLAGFGHDAGIKGAAAQHLKWRCGKGGGWTDTGLSLRHRGYLFETATAGHHMLWADCRRDAKTDRQLAGWYVGGDLVTQLVVHRLILAEKPGQMFGNADTATPARIVDKGDAKALFNGAGTLAKPINGNTESLRPTVDRAFIGNRLERGKFGTSNHSKNLTFNPITGQNPSSLHVFWQFHRFNLPGFQPCPDFRQKKTGMRRSE